MITKNSIIIAEPLVAGRPVFDRTGSILRGLSALATTNLPYTEDYRQEIVEHTAESEEFKLVFDQAATGLAEGIKEAFRELSVYGKGFVNTLAGALSETMCEKLGYEGITYQLSRDLKLNFIKADNDFFSSLIYPTEVKNKNWSYEGVDLSALKELKFGWLSDDQLAEWLGATHPDVIKCLRDSDVALSDSFQQLTDLNNMCKMFTHEGNVFNFAHVKTVQTYNLFQMYFILTKMYLSDTPISALQSGPMETYRAWVNMLWNAMTLQLIKVKNLCNNFRARTIVLFENDKPIEIVNGKIGNGTIQLLRGNATIVYTSVALKMLTDNNMSLSDWAIARALSKYSRRSKDVDSMALLSGSEAKWLIEDYVGENRSRFLEAANDIFLLEAKNALIKWFGTIPELKEIAQARFGENSGVSKLWDELYTNAGSEFRRCIAVVNDNQELAFNHVVMSTNLPGNFLRIIGCGFAADVIDGTITDKELSEEDRRVQLNHAVTQALVKNIIRS